MTYNCVSAQNTQNLGFLLGQKVFEGAVILCTGELGAGKTCLTKGLAQGLGIQDEVTSPTFVLIKEYTDGRLPLYHMDLYRLEKEVSVFDLGLDDYLYGCGVCVIEWADKAPLVVFPKEYLHIQIIFSNQGRHIKLTAHGTLYEKMMEEMPLKCI